MAVRFATPRYCIQHSRFTKQDGWRLWDLSLSLNGNIAVTGYNVNTDRTYIDVYTNVRHSDSRDKPKIIYSKEFEKYTAEDGWEYYVRLVSFIDSKGLVIVTCLHDKLELIDLNQDKVIKSCKTEVSFHSQAECLSVREEKEIFIGFYESNKITVYDVIDLNEIKSIILQGIQDGYFPFHMTALADRLVVCVGEYKEGTSDKSLIFEEKNGRILSELTKPTDTVQWYALGLALNITLNVIAVAWSQTWIGTRKGKDVIVFYSLLSENNCSFHIVEIEFGVSRIRISDRGDRIVCKDRVTGECKVYDMSEFFSYEHLKENLQSQLQEEDCLKLTDFFALSDDQRDEIFKSDTPTENLLLALEGKGVIQPSNVDRLAEAFTELGIKSSCSYLVDFYQKTRLQATPYGRFLATLSAHLTASLPADLCKYFDISDEKKSSITSSPDPGLSLILALDEIGIIKPSEVEALEQPFSELRLVQAEAKIHEYQLVIEEENNQLQRQTELTEAGKRELFVQCLQKKIQSWYETMTPVPWKKSCRWKSTDLFVGSGLILTDSKAKRSLTDIDEECKLQYHQILNHNRLKAEKRIILEGEPGSGKTMMSSQLAYDWSQGKISEVDVLILLPLKFVNNITLVEAVKRFYFSAYDSISAHDIESFLTNEDLQSCLVLDGFEEYNSAEMAPAGEPSEVTKVMEKSKYPNCKVILTSRSDYAKDLPACPMLRIGRFGEKERNTYIEKVFADNAGKQQEIKRAIENNQFILDLCRVPLLFVLAVHNIESIVALQQGQIDRVAPFMESMVKQLCTLSDSTSEGSTSDLEGVSDESLLEKFAFDGLCKRQQILSWQRNVLEASITNMKQFLDSGILVVEEEIIKENLRIIQDEKAQDEFSQNKEKKERTKTKRIDQMNQIVQDGAGAMASSLHQGYYSVSESSNENVTAVSSRQVPYATEEHISSRKRFWKRFKPKVFTKKKVLHSEGTTSKTNPSGKIPELSSFEKVQADRDHTAQECLVALPPAPGPVQLKPESQSESELSDLQKTSNSSTAKDYPLEVKFLHKVMQEWFASKHFSSLLWKSSYNKSLHTLAYTVLPQISPIDLHYILRFTSYLCPPSCSVIMDFLSQNHRTVNGVIPEYIMNCICLCFAECKQENVPQTPSWIKATMKENVDLIVAKLCREVITIRSDDSRIIQQSKVTMLKYAASVGILIKEVHLVDAVLEVDETSTTLSSGVTFDIFNMTEVLEMSRWDQHLKQEDYQSIVKLVLWSNSIKKACLHFPSQPPDIQKEVLDDLVIYDKTVEWIIGPKLVQMLNMETLKWEVTVRTSDVHAHALTQMPPAEVVAQVRWDYEAKNPDELTIRVGDIISHITWEEDEGWWKGEVNGKRGVFPNNFVKVTLRTSDVHAHALTQMPPAEVAAQVEWDYEAREPDELTIRVGDIITHISLMEHGWWEGEVKGKRGMFPCNYVKVKIVNPFKPAARKRGVLGQEDTRLIQTDKNASKKGKVRAKVITCYEPQEDDELSLEVNEQIEVTDQSQQWWWEGIANGKKGMFPSTYVMLLPEKEEMEQHDNETPVEAQVIYNYDAVEPDELTIKVGDIITDISVIDDGWCKGVVNGKEGMFPSNFVKVSKEPPEQSSQRRKVLAKVTSSYTSQSDREVSLVEGDIIEIITSQQDLFWWEGVVNGKQGHFPSHCVQVPIPEDGEERKQQDYETLGAYSWHEKIFEAEAVISREGGKLHIPNTGVKLYIPPNAFKDDIDQCLLQMRIILPGTYDVPATSFTSNTSTVVELLPNNLRLQQTVILTLPHCLDLEVDPGDGSYTASIFISHHEKGTPPVWEAKSNLLYYLDDTKCIIWLESFCWVKFEVNGAIVKGKKIQVFAAGKVLESGDNIAETEVGYFPDLPSGGEILRNNKNLILSQQKPFLFLKKTKVPLTLSLSEVTPPIWKPLNDSKEIPYEYIASSMEYSCPFIFQNESQLSPVPLCIFWISQGLRGFQLTMRPKALPTVLPNQSQENIRESEDPMLDCFLFLKRKLIKDWKDFGRYLRLSEDEISRLRYENKDDVRECIYQMLLTWRRKCGSRATYEKLVEALKKLDRKDLAENLPSL